MTTSDTQPYRAVADTPEPKPKAKPRKPIRKLRQKPKVESEIKPKVEAKVKQVEMFEPEPEPKRERLAVWTQNGSRKWNQLRYKLHSIIIESKKSGQGDIESFCSFADDESVQTLFKSHSNKSVREWDRDSIIESARIRMKQDLEAIIKDESVPAVSKPEDIPDFYPRSILEKGKKKNPLLDFFVKAGGKLE